MTPVSREDRWWILACLIGAVTFTQPHRGLIDWVMIGIWVILLVLSTLLTHKTSPVRTTGVSTPADMVRAQMEAFKVAGFDDDQAKALIQEAMRVAVKQQGGWRA